MLPSSSSSFAENINYITRFDDFIRLRNVRGAGTPIHGIPVIPLYYFDGHEKIYILYIIKYMSMFKDVAVAVPGDMIQKDKQVIYCSMKPLLCVGYVKSVIDTLVQYKVRRFHVIHPTKKVERILKNKFVNGEIILSTQLKRPKCP
jgi:hypothetical protein